MSSVDIFKEYDILIESEAFKRFSESEDRESANDFYLVHVYQMIGKDDSSRLEFGFYNESTDRIVVFETNPIRMRDEEEVFKEASTINPLNLDYVHVSMPDALELAEKTCKEKYPSEIIHKRIILLQNIERQVWNITFISMAFNIINIKIDSESKEVVDVNIHSIMSLGKRE